MVRGETDWAASLPYLAEQIGGEGRGMCAFADRLYVLVEFCVRCLEHPAV